MLQEERNLSFHLVAEQRRRPVFWGCRGSSPSEGFPAQAWRLQPTKQVFLQILRSQWIRTPMPPTSSSCTQGSPFSRRLPGEQSPLSAGPWAPFTLYHPSTCAPSSLGALPTWVCAHSRGLARRMGGRASWDIAAGSRSLWALFR